MTPEASSEDSAVPLQSGPSVRWWQLTAPCPNCDTYMDWTDVRGPADKLPTVTCENCKEKVQVHQQRDTLPGEPAEYER